MPSIGFPGDQDDDCLWVEFVREAESGHDAFIQMSDHGLRSTLRFWASTAELEIDAIEADSPGSGAFSTWADNCLEPWAVANRYRVCFALVTNKRLEASLLRRSYTSDSLDPPTLCRQY